jgi:hypothetical protein
MTTPIQVTREELQKYNGNELYESYKSRMKFLHSLAIKNRETLKMPKGVTFPLKTDAMLKWVENQSTDLLKRVARVIASAARHISFVEFYNKLMMAAIWIENRYLPILRRDTAQGRPVYPLVLLPGKDPVAKSNLWVLLLVLQAGFANQFGVITDINEAIQLHEKIPNAMIPVIVYDDATYTGTQIRTNIEPVFVVDRKYLELFTDGTIKYVIAVPFHTKQAVVRIRNGDPDYQDRPILDVTFCPYAEILSQVSELSPDIRGLITELKDNREDYRIARKYMGFSDVCTAVYFDHKIPDSLSTARRSFLYGEVMKLVDTEGTLRFFAQQREEPLIKGCEYLQKDTPNTRDERAFEDEACPRSYYKLLRYKRPDGTPISPSLDVSQLLDP